MIRRRIAMSSLLGGVLLVGALGVASCKQGENDHCQVNADCDEPLVCAQATMTCETSSGVGIDAVVPDGTIVDAVPDSPPPDAAPDAPPDSAIDAPIDSALL